MRDRVDVLEALWLWQTLRNWREVAKRMVRPNGISYTCDAIQAAVRRHDKHYRLHRT